MEHAEWLEERRKGIGGSDIAAIMGLNPWKTPYRVYQEKRKEVDDWEGNEATDWGKRMEPAIRQWYSDQTGRPVRLPDKIMYSTKHPFMLANLDGFTDDRRIVEIKTARSGKDWGEPGTSEIPDYYILQVQHYMIVTGFDVADVAVSIGGASPSLYEVDADEELQEYIITACERFWQRVQAGDPPEPVSYADAVQRYGRSKAEGAVIANGGVVQLVNDLRGVRRRMNELQREESDFKAEIISYLGNLGDALVDTDGSTLVTYKLAKGRTTLDVKALQKELPEVYERFIKTEEPSRRFLLK
ncbi:YqaJ viral recombinase family protein [Aminivibrio sp.]|uniref:YqaJ viral recombinase family nuclease n=1 Tax=Aminivibrio sp. TaxID=1872489 RepID=UPI00345E8163